MNGIKKSIQGLLILSVCGLGLMGCQAGKNRTYIDVFQDMMDQISVKAQDWDPMQGGKPGVRQPPKGTYPRGYQPLPYAVQTDPSKAGQLLKNPYAGNFSPEVLKVGHENYEIYCMVCHGATGKGDGPVSVKMMVKPRNLLSDRVVHYKDGRIYYVITKGFGVMGSYATQIIDPKARWAVVNYVRTLQKKASK